MQAIGSEVAGVVETGMARDLDQVRTVLGGEAPDCVVDELDPGFWAEGFAMFQHYNSPWVSLVDLDDLVAEVDRLARLGVGTIASCHSPVITEAYVDKAFQLLREVPGATAPPQPGQPVLDQIISSLIGG